MELTGDQIYTLVETTLSMTGNRGAVCNDSTLYVSSGFEMDITKKDGDRDWWNMGDSWRSRPITLLSDKCRRESRKLNIFCPLR